MPSTTVPALLQASRPWRSAYLYVGLGLLATGIGAYFLLWAIDATNAQAVLLACGMLFVAGKEAAIPLATTTTAVYQGGDPWVVGIALLWLDVAMTLILFPFVNTAMDGAHRNKGLLGGMVRGMRRRAEKKRPFIDRYGGLGLFLFMLVPFGFNGPLQSMIIANLVRLRHGPTMVAMLAAMTVTVLAWVVLMRKLHELHGTVPGWVPTAVALGVAGVAMFLSLKAGLAERRRERAEAERKA